MNEDGTITVDSISYTLSTAPGSSDNEGRSNDVYSSEITLKATADDTGTIIAKDHAFTYDTRNKTLNVKRGSAVHGVTVVVEPVSYTRDAGRNDEVSVITLHTP